MAKKGTITVNGKEYTVQHPGAMWYLELTDRHRGSNGFPKQAPYARELIEEVVKQPKLTVEDFQEDIPGLQEAIRKIERFLGEQPDQGAAESDRGESLETDSE
ncbi:hypothetical protein [Salibacterium halotolerans]|uniref:Uncharacterized protein n=1 Tax=Salibacterium halotolerans TaxID=1884432 RepID=A0A1I5NAG1_9BACI|nr:hypothetical protein [Salibacterium halotolerans]SFP18848.1 hypothetical protein SAMN05518683_10362 [Salibacterium halotolerans]